MSQSIIILGASRCPASISASRTGQGAVREVDRPNPQLGTSAGAAITLPARTDRGQGLKLSFHAANPIVEAALVVHGWSAAGRVVPVSGSQPDEVTESFRLTPHFGEASLLDSDIHTRRMAAVSWIEITLLRYADGSWWRPSSTSSCRITPSLYQLVASSH